MKSEQKVRQRKKANATALAETKTEVVEACKENSKTRKQ